MTDKLKTLAEEAKRFDGGDWYLFKHLTTDWSMDKQDAAYIAAVSPDVVLGLIAEVERLKAVIATLRLRIQTLVAENEYLRSKVINTWGEK